MENEKKESLLEKGKKWINLITIEPAFLLHMVAASMGNIMLRELMLDRACRINLAFSDQVCDNRSRVVEEQIQYVYTDINTWREVLDNAFPAFAVLFLGAWSDIYGRKLIFILPIFGQIVRFIGLLLCVNFDQLSADWVGVIGTIPVALTGSRTLLSLATYSYITDISSVRDRTLRIGLLASVRTFGRSLGSSVGGFLNTKGMDYVGLFAIGGFLEVFAFAQAVFYMRNTRKANAVRGTGKCAVVQDMFKVKNTVDTFKSFVKKREGKKRMILYALTITLFFTMAPIQGEESVIRLFTRLKLGWDVGDFGYHSTFRMIVNFAGGLLSIGILSTWLKFSDSMIGILSCLSQIAAAVIYAFANNTFMMYLAPLIDVLNGTMIIATRSMISKIIPFSEIGKVNTFIGVLEATAPLAANPLYTRFYNATLADFPGAFFLVSGVLTLPCLIIYAWLRIKHLSEFTSKTSERVEKSEKRGKEDRSSGAYENHGMEIEAPSLPQIQNNLELDEKSESNFVKV